MKPSVSRSCYQGYRALRAVPATLLLAMLATLTVPLPGIAIAESVTLDRPVPAFLIKKDNSRLRGRVVSYDDGNFQLQDIKTKKSQDVAWSDIDPKIVYSLQQKLRPGKGESYIAIARFMAKLEGGEEYVERALKRAVAINRALADEVEKARAEIGGGAPNDDKAGDKAGSSGESKSGSPSGKVTGPLSPDGKPITWGALTDEQRKEVISQRKARAKELQKRIGRKVLEGETKYFLFYTDLPNKEAVRWGNLLDEMYDIFCKDFDIPKGTNVWHGKCEIWVFQNKRDYIAFTAAYSGRPAPEWSAGVAMSSTETTIAFYRMPDEMTFANVLVHEAAHGFLHRYRSRNFIPSWINEGLAEFFTDRIVRNNTQVARKERSSIMALKKSGRIGSSFFQRIGPGEYGTASGLCKFMLANQPKKGAYLAFINGIKDGMPWREALEKKYGATLEQVVAAWGNSVGIRNLTP